MSRYIEKLELREDTDKNMIMAFLIGCPAEKADHILVERTAYHMRDRLKAQREKGFHGWNTPQCSNEDLLRRLKGNLDRGELLDVINLAAMILARNGMFQEIYIG